jgi:Dynamin central region
LKGVSLKQRNLNERNFFQNPPWNALPRQRMGIDALKDFLGQLLLGHIRKEYPHVVKEIENLVEKTEKDLEACGPPRQTAAEQRRYLTRVATTYQKQVSDSLIGLYNTDLSSKHPLKLRLNIRTLNEEFADDFKHNGHRRVFKAVDGGIDKDFARYSTVAVEDEEDIYEWIREVYRDFPPAIHPLARYL